MQAVEQPKYGASDHYLGDKGKAYFAWQSGAGAFGARINARKFMQHIQPNHTVLDFGCGGGFLLKAFDCVRRIGVEVNPVARDHASALGVECHADVAEVTDGAADVIISDHALEHIPYPIGALRDLRAKLKPGGLLALVVPIENWRRQKRYDANDLNHHLQTWTPQLLGNTLVEAGYEVISVRARIYAWPGNWTVFAFGRLPLWMFDSICFSYGFLTGKGWEVLALARPAMAS